MYQLWDVGKGRWDGFQDKTEVWTTIKLKRRTFAAIFFLACIAVLEWEQVVLEEI